MINLNKTLPAFILPIMLVILVILIGLIWNKKKLIYFAIIILYILSTPIFSNNFFKLVEGTEYRISLYSINNADAIIVLSGNLSINEMMDSTYIEWGDPDRFFAGIDLFKAGKAKKLVFTGGKMPWGKTKKTEGDVLKEYAISMGIPKANILIGKDANNTYEEAKTIKQLLNYENKIIIVTSAFHMSRAKNIFEKMGFKVIPFKVDYKTNPNLKITILDFVPNADSLEVTETGIREMLGRFLYIFIAC